MVNLPALFNAALSDSITEHQARVSGLRYGKHGTLLFDYAGETYSTPEPMDVMPVGSGKAGDRWAACRYAMGECVKVSQ